MRLVIFLASNQQMMTTVLTLSQSPEPIALCDSMNRTEQTVRTDHQRVSPTY